MPVLKDSKVTRTAWGRYAVLVREFRIKIGTVRVSYQKESGIWSAKIKEKVLPGHQHAYARTRREAFQKLRKALAVQADPTIADIEKKLQGGWDPLNLHRSSGQ